MNGWVAGQGDVCRFGCCIIKIADGITPKVFEMKRSCNDEELGGLGKVGQCQSDLENFQSAISKKPLKIQTCD